MNSQKWNLAHFSISAFGAALNLFLLSQPPPVNEAGWVKPMFALIAVLLILRAVRYGSRL